MIDELEGWLGEITGFAAVSLQPNAGSQGEYAGLLAIRRYHRERGDAQPHGLPDSLLRARHQPGKCGDGGHGRVVVVKCTEDGRHRRRRPEGERPRSISDRLAALMITYPSTHGVFEEGVRDICATGA
jgi:glycine dehydrogenase